jgi:hypothetical protein
MNKIISITKENKTKYYLLKDKIKKENKILGWIITILFSIFWFGYCYLIFNLIV